MNNFTYQKIYFFEGEPDMYCAIDLGMEGAVTLGSAANINLSRTFSPEEMTHTFKGKEIVICLDADGPGREAAMRLANQLYPYAKQIKMIDLDKSDTNIYGLDPTLLIDIKDENGKVVKQKRAEKDFTDFMKKNGPWDQALQRFRVLEDTTNAFVHNVDRVANVTYKVTLQEARNPKYYSPEGKIELEVIGAVSDYNCDAYMFASKVRVVCPGMDDAKHGGISGRCKDCGLTKKPGFLTGVDFLDFEFVRKQTKETINNPFIIHVDEHNMLGMIEVTEQQKIMQQKRMIDIHDPCRRVRILEMSRHKKIGRAHV
jgi:5S rRNA maturation endonuclease (ribonuclease M5)